MATTFLDTKVSKQHQLNVKLKRYILCLSFCDILYITKACSNTKNNIYSVITLFTIVAKLIYFPQFCNLWQAPKIIRTAFKINDYIENGGATVQHACSNGHAICKDLGLSPTYDQWSFSLVTRFLHSTPTLTSVPCAPINQLNAIRGACKTSKKKLTKGVAKSI